MKKLFLFLSVSFSLQAQSDSTNIIFSEEKVEKLLVFLTIQDKA
jgi:hypothetical protein